MEKVTISVSSDFPTAIEEMVDAGNAVLPISVDTGLLVWASVTLNNRPDSEPTKRVDFPVGE